MRPLKIGDRVVCIKDFDMGGWTKISGTVAVIRIMYDDLGVIFDEKSPIIGMGHNLSGKATKNGWWFPCSDANRYLKRIDKNIQPEFDF